MRRRVVAVIGSGQTADPACVEIGQLIASLGVDLLTGGGRGVMEEVSRAFFEVSPRDGVVVGIIPATVDPIEALERRGFNPPRGLTKGEANYAVERPTPGACGRTS